MTEQETNKEAQQRVFDKAVLHCVTQDRQCNNPDGSCSYLNEHGLRCAIGGTVDLETAKKLSRPSVESGAVGKALPRGFTAVDKVVCKAIDLQVTVENVRFLRAVQISHDRANLDFRNEFLRSARRVADRYDLTMPDISA